MLTFRNALTTLVVFGLQGCSPAQRSGSFEVPTIEEAAPAGGAAQVAGAATCDAPVDSSSPRGPVEVTFDVTFDGATALFPSAASASSPLSSMRMVMAPGGTERAVEIMGDELMLTGTAEAISNHRWLVGVSGFTADACVVVRMTAQSDGDGLTGWAVVDTEGRASSLSFVAVPSPAADAG